MNWTSGLFLGYHKDGMRKKIVLISLIATLSLLGILCYKSWFAGFVLTKYLSGRKDGKQGIVRSITVPWRNYRLNMHHWFICLIVGGICAVKGFYIVAPEVFYGFLSAVIFQGIYCYGDWYRIVMRSRRMTPTSRGLLTGVLKGQDYGIDKSLPPIRFRHTLTKNGAASLSSGTLTTCFSSGHSSHVLCHKLLECTASNHDHLVSGASKRPRLPLSSSPCIFH